MKTYPRIIIALMKMVESNEALKAELKLCILQAYEQWEKQLNPPSWALFQTLEGFYGYLDLLLNTTPADSDFDDLFHEIFFVISQDDNVLQKNAEFAGFQEWLSVFVEVYGSYMNTPQSANNVYSFTNDKTFEIDLFTIPPGGFNSFNTFFSRYIRPGERPIGTKTYPFDPPSEGNPVGDSPTEDADDIYKNMVDDRVIVVPADSVYKGCWPISEKDTIQVSKGNTYSIKELLGRSQYADYFRGGLFTHSYLTVFTYHRYHVPVRGIVLETDIISGEVFANVELNDGHLGATDGTGYQFKQDRGLIVMDSPVGKVAMIAIGMDFISSCNLSVSAGAYLNKGDEFGYFLFGGSDMIMLFENPDISIEIQDAYIGKFFKLGQVFGRVE
jgi:phosphatidylserine decarboxylase